MTFIGKLFVMLNVAISLMMLTAAVGLFSTRTDWSDQSAKQGAPAGEMVRRKAAIKELQDTITPAEGTWRTAYGDLFKQETVRYDSRKFFSDKLDHNRSKATPDLPAWTSKLDKGGLPEADANGRPILVAANDRNATALVALTTYGVQLTAQQAKTAAALKDLDEEAKKDIKLTNELAGEGGGKKGLRDEIREEKIKREGIIEEVTQTRPLFTNTRVDAAIARRRIELLDEQIADLRKKVKKLKELDGEP